MEVAIVSMKYACLLLACAGCIAIPLHPKTGERPLPEAFTAKYPYEWVDVPVDEETVLRGIWLDRGGPPVLVLYGAGMSIQRTAELLAILHDGGYSALCCDYRGVGYSSGRKGKSRYIDDDARALWEWLRKEKGEPAGVMGISIGSIAAAPLARHPHPPAAIVLDRPVDPRNVVYRWVKAYLGGTVSSWIARVLVRTSTDVDVRGCLEEARTDVLMVLPEYDVLLPPDDAAALTEGLPARVQVVTVPGGHVSSQLVEPSTWRGAILDFLDARLHPAEPGGGRVMDPGPAKVVEWRREGRTLHVTLDRDLPDGVKLLHLGLKRNAAIWIEHAGREITVELPRKHRHRTFDVRVVPKDYENPVATKWITDPPASGQLSAARSQMPAVGDAAR